MIEFPKFRFGFKMQTKLLESISSLMCKICSNILKLLLQFGKVESTTAYRRFLLFVAIIATQCAGFCSRGRLISYNLFVLICTDRRLLASLIARFYINHDQKPRGGHLNEATGIPLTRSALRCSSCKRSSRDICGRSPRIRAAIPLTNGAAILVPELRA